MKSLICLILAPVAPLFIALPVYAATPSIVVSQYISWRGGPALIAAKTITEIGTFTDGGLSGPARITTTTTGDTAASLHFGPFSMTLVAAGSTGAYSNFSGQSLPLSPIEIGYARSDAASLFPTAVLSAELKPDEQVAGRQCAVLETTGPGGAHYDYLISPATGALYGIRTRRNGATELQTFTDWRIVDGVRLAFHIHNSGDAGLGLINDDTTDLTIKTATINAPLAASAFGLPPSRLVPRFAAGQSSSGWIPIRIADNEIYLPLHINGHSVQAILDSGASLTVVDSHIAPTLGIRGVGAFTTAGEGGLAGISYAPGVTVTAGTMRLPNITAGLIDLGLPGVKITPPLVAILGAEAINQTTVDIDYPHHRLRFLAPAATTPLPGAVTLPLGSLLGGFTIPISVEGRSPIPVLLDTGNDGTFQLFPAYWQRLHLLDHRPTSAGRGGGVGGLETYRLASLATLGIGSITVHDLGTAFEPPGIDSINQTDILGNIGGEVISRFHVIIDFPNRRISFMPVAGSLAPFHHELVGLETEPEGNALKIFFVMPNSPAAAAGLKKGDEIIAVDGKPPPMNSTQNWQTATAGKPIKLSLRDGGNKTIMPARFYLVLSKTTLSACATKPLKAVGEPSAKTRYGLSRLSAHPRRLDATHNCSEAAVCEFGSLRRCCVESG